MSAQERLTSLREGGWIKACLEGTEWIGNERECFTDADLLRPPVGKSAHEHALYNAAKVEVTKVVLEYALDQLTMAKYEHHNIRCAVELLKQLKESL
jgi:hypothetical protein